MTDECDPTVAMQVLSQQAFSVYCDQVVRDAVEKNDKLRAENATMEAARKMLTHMTIYKNLDDELNTFFNESCEKVMEINLQTAVVGGGQQQNQNQASMSHVLVYDVESNAIEFPYEDAPRLYCEISSVRLRDGLNGVIPSRLTVKNDETVELEFHPIHDVKITGTLKNFSGTVHEVQQMIESGEFPSYFMRIGFKDPETGQPFPKTVGNSLDGAICSLKKVEIAKTRIHSIHIMKDNQVNDGLQVDESDEEDKELHVLANANKKHEGLCKAIIDRPVLKARNSLLKHSREVFQTLTAQYPGTTLQFKIEQGSVGRMLGQAAGAARQEAAWVVTADNKDESTILLSAMSQLRLLLANVTWFTVPPVVVGRPNGLILKYSNNIEAVFHFDETLDDVDVDNLPGGLYQYIYHALSLNPQQGGHWQRQHRLHQQQGPQFTMRLVAFHIQLSAIQSHLDALGIVANTNEE